MILRLLLMVREMGILRAMKYGSITLTGITPQRNSTLLKLTEISQE